MYLILLNCCFCFVCKYFFLKHFTLVESCSSCTIMKVLQFNLFIHLFFILIFMEGKIFVFEFFKWIKLRIQIVFYHKTWVLFQKVSLCFSCLQEGNDKKCFEESRKRVLKAKWVIVSMMVSRDIQTILIQQFSFSRFWFIIANVKKSKLLCWRCFEHCFTSFLFSLMKSFNLFCSRICLHK